MGLGRYLKKRDDETGLAAPSSMAATSALTRADGPLGAFPDPMAVVRRDGTIAASNSAASPIGAMIADGGALGDVVADALKTGEDRRATVDREDCAAIEGVWHVTVHPLPGGEAAMVHASDVTPDRTLRDTLV
jgi:hypothetical protein